MSTLRYFTAPWCSPCKMFSPVMEEISNDFNNVIVEKYNVDEEDDLVIKHSIMNVPTVIKLDEEGNEVNRIMGAYPYDKVVEEFNL